MTGVIRIAIAIAGSLGRRRPAPRDGEPDARDRLLAPCDLRCCLFPQEIEMRTTKTIPTLMRAVSFGAAMMLVSEAAVARDDGHQGHSDRQDRNEIQRRDNGPTARSGRPSGQSDKKAGAFTWGGSPPRSPPPAGEGLHVNGGAKSRTPISLKGDPMTNGKSGLAGTPAKTPVSATEPITTGMHGGSAPTSPVATANPAPAAGPPAGAAVVSNGQVKLYIPNSPSGLSVTSDKPGSITVSNGDPSHSVTLPGGSVTISGGTVNTVAGGSGVQVVSHPNGDFVAAANTPPPTTTVTGGPEGGFVNALGNGLVDTGKGILNTLNPVSGWNVKPEGPPPPPPQTSTSVQR
jgi:hypothetical protein